MKKKYVGIILLAGMCILCSCSNGNDQPNVIIIYSDDIGYGDIGVYGAELIPTPNIDKLASEGIQFTDGHCAASTCSPSRYALLTGEMGFRKNVDIQSVNAPATIRPTQFTLGKLFQKAGYKTGIIGKWHLGLGNGDVNWNKEIKPGPLEVGFDYCFIISSSNDRAPFVYVENHRVYNDDPNDPITVSRDRIPDSVPGTKYPDAILNPESVTVYESDRGHRCSVINGVGRIGYMKGGKKALWDDNKIADNLVEKAEEFIAKNNDNPFLLLLTTNDIHAPRLPHPRFKGVTDLGYRGDNVVQLDWCVGEVMKMLKDKGIEKNTILIFSSDNGPVYIDGGYQDGSDKGNHRAAGIYRGGKYQIYEGGTRVPFIIRWPTVIKPKVSEALVSQVDLLASFAGFLKIEIPKDAAMDSRNYWNSFIGKDPKGADVILEQTNTQKGLAIRKGKMKYINIQNEKYEMYNLELDPSEENNIISAQSELAKELHQDLMKLCEVHLNTYSKRTQFFPKAEIKVESMPDNKNLWVFILAGQSNMAGRGFVEPEDTIPTDRVLTINKNGEIILAKEPLHFYYPRLTGLDCGLSFGKTLIKQIPDSISVLVIPTAIGGTTISQWLGDSTRRNVPLLTNFREKVKIGKKYGQVKGILWHQGEGDANQVDIPLYKNRLSELFSEFREIVGDEKLPILIGELGAYPNKYSKNWIKINEQIRAYASTDSNAAVVETSDLKDKGDKIHFNSDGQRVLGQRFADQYIRSQKLPTHNNENRSLGGK